MISYIQTGIFFLNTKKMFLKIISLKKKIYLIILETEGIIGKG